MAADGLELAKQLAVDRESALVVREGGACTPRVITGCLNVRVACNKHALASRRSGGRDVHNEGAAGFRVW